MRNIFCASLILVSFCSALESEIGGWRATLNGYADFEYTYMSSMPMNMNVEVGNNVLPVDQQVMTMPAVSFIDQNRLNLVTNFSKKKLRLHINFQSRHSFTTDFADDGEGLG